MNDGKVILEFQGITKSFQGLLANDAIDLAIRQGEIHALLGENGAGKTTLMNVLTGLYRADSGRILVDGREVHIRSPKDSINLGIGMVHQHFRLVDTLSVAENIVMGWHGQGWIIRRSRLNKELAQIARRYDFPIQPRKLVRDISAGGKQCVEIVKMLYRRVNILVLDEPTSVLTPQETGKLFENLRRMKAEGKTVIFISHKLNEIMAIADRVTVLRGGKLITTLPTSETNPHKLAGLMIGREMQTIEKRAVDEGKLQRTILAVQELSTPSSEVSVGLKDISLSIDAGEVLGIAGVSGNGQSELCEVLSGLRPVVRGKILLEGRRLRAGHPREFISAGVSHIPEDRIGKGTIGNFSCIENVILKSYRKPPIRRAFALDSRAAARAAVQMLKEYDVRMSSPQDPVKLLSGGNIQKLILAREISCSPKLLIAMHPTYGLDVSAVEMVHAYLLKEQERGSAILLISEDLDEILELSDSISVMYHGSLTPKRHRNEWTIEEIGYQMMGISAQGKAERA